MAIAEEVETPFLPPQRDRALNSELSGEAQCLTGESKEEVFKRRRKIRYGFVWRCIGDCSTDLTEMMKSNGVSSAGARLREMEREVSRI